MLIACPTCGRLQFDMDSVVAEIEQRLEGYEEPIEVAVLGCAVNGIGEASHADFGIAGAKNEGLIFAHGKPLRKVPQEKLVDTLFEEIDKSLDRGKVEFDEAEAARGSRLGGQDRGGERGRPDAGEDRADGARGGAKRASPTGFCSTRRPRRRPGAGSPGHRQGPPVDRFPGVSRLSQTFLPTLKDPPADAEAVSHKLMVRAGLIRQLGAGLWTYLPAGWRVQRKIEADHPRGDGRRSAARRC